MTEHEAIQKIRELYEQTNEEADGPHLSGADFIDEVQAVLLCTSQKAPRVVVHVEGGIVQGWVADVPVDVIVLDYDVEGADEDEISTNGAGDDCVVRSWEETDFGTEVVDEVLGPDILREIGGA